MSIQKFSSATNRRIMLGSMMSLPVALSLTLQAHASLSLEEKWLEFQQDTPSFMEKTPPKWDSNGNLLSNHRRNTFSAEDVKSGEYVSKKASFRLSNAGTDLVSPICNASGVCLPDILEGRAAARERIQDFLDMHEFRKKKLKPLATLEEMEAQNLREAKLEEIPWSDSYWPISQGVLGARYASSVFMKDRGHNWKSYYDFINSKDSTFKEIYLKGDAEELERLSPSEKYDLLIGDLGGDGKSYEAGYLTPKMWEEGKYYFEKSGQVEPWMGICHGWAPAAFMMERPRNSVKLPAADGRNQLKFYPADIKGLASHLWAKASVPTNFIGGRCNQKAPKRDPETGRNVSEECFDTNPGNWHVAVVNQIGQAKRSFILDATYDYEVWNQPVYSYKYRYFNPQTGKSVDTLEKATVAKGDFTKDKFKKFRSAKTAFVVGIEMDVTYVVETLPTTRETDSQSYDAVEKVTYMYDLELNDKNQIIGGEWYSNKHPDFLWLPLMHGRAESYGDSMIGGEVWDVNQPLPLFWRDLAIATATRYNQPLAGIVEALIQAAQQEPKR